MGCRLDAGHRHQHTDTRLIASLISAQLFYRNQPPKYGLTGQGESRRLECSAMGSTVGNAQKVLVLVYAPPDSRKELVTCSCSCACQKASTVNGLSLSLLSVRYALQCLQIEARHLHNLSGVLGRHLVTNLEMGAYNTKPFQFPAPISLSTWEAAPLAQMPPGPVRGGPAPLGPAPPTTQAYRGGAWTVNTDAVHACATSL